MENWGIVLGIAVAAGVGAYFYGRKPTRTGRLRQALAAVAERDLALVEQTGADELIFTCDLYEHADRLHSYELLAQVMQG